MAGNGRLPGILIAIDGVDGAGKTTQVERLRNVLRSAGEDVVTSKEPTNGPHGQRLRASAQSGRMDAADELATFIADRREHVEKVIRPNLLRGRIVIVDRYFYSTIAYQGARTGYHPCEFYRDMQEFPTPDIAFLIDVPSETGVHRIAATRGDIPNHFERIESLKVIRELFLELVKCAPELRCVNGQPDIDSVYHEIIHHLIGVLQSKRCLKPWGCDMLLCSYRLAGECGWPSARAKLLQPSLHNVL